MLNKDYKEMLQCLLEEGVRFLLVGAYAVAARASGRTQDLADLEKLESGQPQNQKPASLNRYRSGVSAPDEPVAARVSVRPSREHSKQSLWS